MSRFGRRPFENCAPVRVVLPENLHDLPAADAALLAGLPAMLERERSQLEIELGATFFVDPSSSSAGPRWFIGPHSTNEHMAQWAPVQTPTLRLNRSKQVLVSDAPTAAGVFQTFSGLRSLYRHQSGPLHVDGCRSVIEAVNRVLVEVADTYPAFALRNLNWAQLSRKHIFRVRAASNPVLAMQKWLSELGDPHTWVRPSRTQMVLPYGAAVVGGEVWITHAQPWTAGYQAGLRPGWRLVGEAVDNVWAATPGATHSRPSWVARRLLSGSAGTERELEARGPNGEWARWREPFEVPTGPPAAWWRRPSGTGVLWIGAWVPGFGVEEVIEEAITELQKSNRLIVDLRGNSGGRLHMATAFRDRFIEKPRTIGYIRTTEPGGRLGASRSLTASPSEDTRWPHPVRFLTNPLTYSSSEDAMLGLQGQPQVQVWGEPSGGGSGRVRKMRLLPGWRLTISSALTYDVRGHCVEGAGIPVDHPFTIDPHESKGDDPLMEAADQGW